MNPTHHHQPPSPSSSGGNKAKTAGSRDDLIRSASSLGKGKSFGKYLGKAENYLRKYQRSHSSASATSVSFATSASTAVTISYPALAIPDGPPPTMAPMGYLSPAGDPPAAAMPVGCPPTAAPLGYPPGGDHLYRSQSVGHGHSAGSGGKYGDYFKKASGFFKRKHYNV